jgi:hypothetical protein
MESKIQSTTRENFLMAIIQKLVREYKILLDQLRGAKPLKIVEIVEISHEPGATQFLMQITNKNAFIQVSAADIISQGYQLHDFNDFHADMVRHAAQGKLLEFLHLSELEPAYKIVSKKMDRDAQQYLFTIRGADKVLFIRSAHEISQDKDLLENLAIHDIYNIGYTAGSESILREKTALLLAKNKTSPSL